jgi:hypothetical protein
MRFSKGSIEISFAQDMPLLRQVLHSQFITHEQLFEFMDIGNYERKRPTFNWRVRRLVQHEFLNRYYFPEIDVSYLYRIGSRAADLAEFAPLFPVRARKAVVEPSMCRHWIELNKIHLSLARRPGLLDEWVSEPAIVSRNLLTTFGYTKDYDAVVTLSVEGGPFRFALEYEQSAKGQAAYLSIRERLESERQVDRFLYLAPTENLLSFLTYCFASIRAELYLGLASDFIHSHVDTPVIDARCRKRTVLREAL